MFVKMRHFIYFVAVVTFCGAEIPPNFKRCYRKDPNFRNCYYHAVQHGMTQLNKAYKELDVPNLEPIEVKSATIRGGGGVVGVDQHFENCKMYGLTKIKYDKFDLNLETNVLEAVGTTPEAVFNCDYELDGKVLLLPIKGKGNSTITIKNFYTDFNATFERIPKGGKTYYKTAHSELKTDVGHVHFQFNNLFDGNKELGDNINLVLNDNWDKIFEEMHADYTEIVRQILTQVIDRIWAKTSLEEYFDE